MIHFNFKTHSNTALGAPNSKLNLRSISDGYNMFRKAKTISTFIPKRSRRKLSVYMTIYFKRLQKIHLKTTVLR